MYSNLSIEQGLPAKLQNIHYEIRGPLQKAADEMEKQGASILRLNIGNPAPFGLRAPEHLLRTYMNRLTEAEGYSDSKGLLSARQAIMAYCRKKGMKPYDIDTVYTYGPARCSWPEAGPFTTSATKPPDGIRI